MTPRQTAVMLLLLMLATLSTVCEAANAYHLVGQWMPATKSSHTEALLVQALQKQDPTASSRLCFTEVSAIEQQIVNGIHFRYHIRGCEAAAPGRCDVDSCTQVGNFDVDVFAQPWTDTVQVIAAVDVE
ncbi:hypothetical protein BBJ28_00010116 [Nothophytophthora sp. Chile5]|nr:hypothetical protein BBJ28_00010116 [Nothophytophthora sp. Chile5]